MNILGRERLRTCLSIFLITLFVVNLFAPVFTKASTNFPIEGELATDASIYSMAGTTGHEADPANKGQSQFLCKLQKGTKVIALSEQIDGDGDKWYEISYGDNFENKGFAYHERVNLKYTYVYDADFEKNLLNFPESYREGLRALHAEYPNWQFKAHNVQLSFQGAVEKQYGVSDVKNTRKWVEFTYGGNEWRDMRGYNASTDSWVTLESRWTYASRSAIEYFMDPRNSLNKDKIFVFMQQSYDAANNTTEALRSVTAGTFLANGYDTNGDGVAEKDAYLNDIMDAAKASGVNPYVLAATIIVEQGINGKTGLISGTYSGYEGYYNFFNFGAAGNDVVVNGLEYAKKQGWNSRKASIVGGASMYADGYISQGQDTYYYKDFNVVNQIWWHQYASALYDAWTNASRLKKGCIVNKDATLTFIIPVYSDMPTNPCPKPTADLGGGTTTTPDPGTGNDPGPEVTVAKGDINSDGSINALDLAEVKMHILGVKKLSGNASQAGDIDNSGSINAVDLAAVKMHILGVKKITN